MAPKPVICYIYQDQYPWEIRTEKITNTLADNGISVHIVSRNRDGLPTSELYQRNICIHRLPKVFTSTLRNIINFPAFFSPFWFHAILSIVRRTGSELIIVRDLPLAITAWIIGKLTNRPVLLDMAENYPAMIEDTWRYRGPRLEDYILRNPKLLRIMERYILPRLDGILVVSAASAERVIQLGVPREVVYIVSNTPSIINCGKENIAEEVRKKSSFIIIYVGGMEETRGLEIVVRAIPQVTLLEPDMLLVLVGKGTSEERLKLLATQLGIEKHVLWLGWQDPKVIPALIRGSDVCLVPHYVTEHTNSTVPNKIFDYMMQKKPVVATDSKALSAIINSSKCGFVYQDNNPSELAEVIVKLRNNKLREELGSSGYRAVLERYNWKVDSQQLLDAILSLSTSRKRVFSYDAYN